MSIDVRTREGRDEIRTLLGPYSTGDEVPFTEAELHNALNYIEELEVSLGNTEASFEDCVRRHEEQARTIERLREALGKVSDDLACSRPSKEVRRYAREALAATEEKRP